MTGAGWALGAVGALALGGALGVRGSFATARPPHAFRALDAWSDWARTQGVDLRLVRTPHGSVEVTDLFADAPGTGAGTKVMQALAAAADQTQMPLRLSPSSRRNVEFYRRFGFELSSHTHDTHMTRTPTRGSRNAPRPSTAAFRRWFKNSQVVDAKGRPKVVYHGTTAPLFEAFALRATPRKEQLGFGLHFTEDWGLAARYAHGETARRAVKGSEPRVIEAWLSIQNPYDATGWVEHDSEGYRVLKQIVGRTLRPFGVQDGVYLYRVGAMLDQVPAPKVFAALQALGYDGVRYTVHVGERVYGGIRTVAEAPGWIAFSPTQVKATDNQGTFSPDDPRMSFNRGAR